MSPPDAPAPTPDQLRAALSALEAHGAHPDTGAIHDPIYELLVDPRPGALDRQRLSCLRRALDRAANHPAQAAVRAALGESFARPPRRLDEVLTELGPWSLDDPVAEVERRLRQAASVHRMLRARLAEQERALGSLTRTLNAMAAVAALLAIFALVGWLGALDLWQITWFTHPAPPASIVSPESAP